MEVDGLKVRYESTHANRYGGSNIRFCNSATDSCLAAAHSTLGD
jgi:hypothetical protein